MIRLKQLLEQVTQNPDVPKELDSIKVTPPNSVTTLPKTIGSDKLKKVKNKRESIHAENFRSVISAVDNILDAWHLQNVYILSTPDSNKLVKAERDFERIKRLFNVKPLTKQLVQQHNADSWTLIELPKQLDNIFTNTNWYNKPELNKKFSNAAYVIEDLAKTLEHTYDEIRGAQWGDMFGGHKL